MSNSSTTIKTKRTTYLHTQTVASSAWTVNHNLGQKYVNITVANSSDEVCIPNITFTDENSLTLIFNQAESGNAFIIYTSGKEKGDVIEQIDPVVEIKSDDYTIVVPDDERKIIMFDSDAASTNSSFSLSAASASEVGFEVTIVKLGTKSLEILISDYFDSVLGRNYYAPIDKASFITFMVNEESKWVLKYSSGGWWPSMNRGVFAGGNAVNTMSYITISSEGFSADFGDLSAVKTYSGSAGSKTIGLVAGGNDPGGNRTAATDYFTFATLGNAVSWGNLTQVRQYPGRGSNGVRATFGAGASTSYSAVIDYFTFATKGNAVGFGSATQARQHPGGTSSNTRAIITGGYITSTFVNTIDYVTIMTTGNAADFGDLTVAGQNVPSSVSNSTRGVIMGGQGRDTTIDYVTITTLGNATDFGDPFQSLAAGSACCSFIKGIAGGQISPILTVINIATTGNGTNWGNLNVPCYRDSASSDCHGGLV